MAKRRAMPNMEIFYYTVTGIFLTGIVLNSAKLIVSLQRKSKTRLTRHIQFTTASNLFISLLSSLGLLAARISRSSSLEVGIEIFLLVVIVYLIANLTCCFIAMTIDRVLSLYRKTYRKSILHVCVWLNLLVPIATSGTLGAIGAHKKQIAGAELIPVLVIFTVISSWLSICLFLRKVRRMLMVVMPLNEDTVFQASKTGQYCPDFSSSQIQARPQELEAFASQNEGTIQLHTNVKTSNIKSPLHTKRLRSSSIPTRPASRTIPLGSPVKTTPLRSHSIPTGPPMKISPIKSPSKMRALKSSLKSTREELEESVKRHVSFVFGEELEIWRREKEFRRLGNEKQVTSVCVLMLACYTLCFVPLSTSCLYYGKFCLKSSVFTINYILAALTVVLDPLVFMVYSKYDGIIDNSSRVTDQNEDS